MDDLSLPMLSPDDMIEALRDGCALRDEVENHIMLMAGRDMISEEQKDDYLRRISEIMDAPSDTVLPAPISDVPLKPTVEPQSRIDNLFPLKSTKNPNSTARTIRKIEFIPYLYDRGITRRGDQWYRFNGRYMEAVKVKDVEDEVCRAATECNVDIPSQAAVSAIVRQAGQSLDEMAVPPMAPEYSEEGGVRNLVFSNCILRGDFSQGRRDRRLEVRAFTYNLWSECPLPDIRYDPSVPEPSALKSMLDLMFPDPDQLTLFYELGGYTAWHGMNPPALFVLYGPAGTGKTTITEILTAILGEDNVSGVTLAGFLGEPGHAQEIQKMEGKRLNVCDESGESVKNVPKLAELLKNLSSGGRTYFNHKYGGDSEGRNRAKLLFCTNVYPSLGSDSGTARRLQILSVENPLEFKRDEDYHEIRSPEALNWLAMRFLEAYIGFLDRGCRFTAPGSSAIEKVRVLLGDSNLVDFLESEAGVGSVDIEAVRTVILDREIYDFNLRDTFYRKYKDYCDEIGQVPMAEKSFLSRIDTVYGVESGKNRERVYKRDFVIPGVDYTAGKDHQQVRRFVDARIKKKNTKKEGSE